MLIFMEFKWIVVKSFLIFLLLLLNSQLFIEAIKPQIVHAPVDTYGLQTQKVSLRCESNNPQDQISWLRNGKLLLNYHDSILSFYLSESEEGGYQCNITSADKSSFILTPIAQVKIAFLDEFPSESAPQMRYVSPGATILLYCNIPEGLPRPEVKWKSNFTNLNFRFKQDIQHNLRIDNVKRADSANYWCEVKNIAGLRRSQPITLVVMQRPVFVMLPQHLQVMVSSSVIFPCLVIGDLPMFVQWYKLGASLASRNNNNQALSRSQIGNNCSMVLKNVQLEDKGAYVCQAKNNGGITEIIFKLSVISHPSFVETPNNIQANIGQSISLSCSATGVPIPMIFWKHKQNYLLSELDNNNERLTVFENGTLYIQSLRTTDSGKYICFAVSFVGTSKSEATLLVKIPENIFPPIITKIPYNITAFEGSTIVINCESSNKNRYFNWYKQELKIVGLNSHNSRTRLLGTGDLEIRDVKIQDSALYTCRVTSHGLFTEKSAILTIKSYSQMNKNNIVIFNKNGMSKPVTNISIEFVGDTYVVIKWKLNAKLEDEIFEIEVAEQYQNLWKVIGRTNSMKYTIKNLRSNTGYQVLIRTKESDKISAFSHYSDVIYTLNKPTIGFDVAFGEFHKALQEIEIFSLKLNSISSRQVKVSWKVRGKSILRSVSGFIIKANPVNIKRCLLLDNKQKRNSFTCLGNQNFQQDQDQFINKLDDDRLISSSVTSNKKYHVYRSITHDRSRTSTVIGDLYPFRCYEVDIETFIDHATAGRISGRDSITRTVLTYDDLPSRSPDLKWFKWLTNDTIQLKWNDLDVIYANGPIIGYYLQIINLKTRNTFAYDIHYNIQQYSVKLSQPQDRHIVYLAAKSCRGIGPRTRPILADRNNPLIDLKMPYQYYQHNKSPPSEFSLIQNQPWMIGAVVGGAVCGLLLTITVVMLLICRRRNYGGIGSGNNFNNNNNHNNLNGSSNQGNCKLMSGSTMMMMIDENGICNYGNNNNNIINNISNGSNASSSSKDQKQKLLSNYETILPLETGFISNIDSAGTPRYVCNANTNCSNAATTGDDPSSITSDSLAYASSSLIYKGCQYYNPSTNATTTTKLPPNYSGNALIDVFPDLKNWPPHQKQQLLMDPQFLAGTIIPPPPMYPPPPAPTTNQINVSSDNNSEMMMLSNHGSHNNTHSSGSTSACGSNRSNNTRLSRTPQSVGNQHHPASSSHNSSSSSRSRQKNIRKAKSSSKKDSLSNSTHSSQRLTSNDPSNSSVRPNTVTKTPPVPTAQQHLAQQSLYRSQQQNQKHYEIDAEDEGELEEADDHLRNDDENDELTSELSETDTGELNDRVNVDWRNCPADEQDSVRVMYKMPLQRPASPDYSTDSSYPYSMANHYSSVEPNNCHSLISNDPVIHGNLPTKF